MDVSQPNNWPRVEELFRRKTWRLTEARHRIVGVGGGNKALDWQAQRFRQQTGSQITKVSWGMVSGSLI
jgi:hypothetical protein